MDPTERMTVDGAMKHHFLKHHFLQPRKMDVLCPTLSAGQGAASLVQGCVDPRLLHWLQTDPAWARLAESFRGQGSEPRAHQHLNPEETALNKTYEEAGFVRENSPKTTVSEEWTRASLVEHLASATSRRSCSVAITVG